MRIFLLLITIFSAAPVMGAEIRDLYRGARETAMGGVSTAVTEGDEAIYLNPAAMAGTRRTTFYLLNADAEISSDSVTTLESSSSAFKNITPATLDQFMGKNIYGEGTLSPALTLPNFGLSVLVDEQFALLVQNKAMPQALLGLQTTSGFQLATGFSVLPRGRRSTSDLRVGFGLKLMFRRGGYHNLTLDQIFNISEDEVKAITGGFGEGVSGDLGLQYVRTLNKSAQLLAGLAYTEMGGMTFSGGGDKQPENLSIGVGSKFSVGRGMGLTLGYDIKHLTQDVEWAKRNHTGKDSQHG